MIARRSLCPEKLGSNPGQGSKGINLSGWHGVMMLCATFVRIGLAKHMIRTWDFLITCHIHHVCHHRVRNEQPSLYQDRGEPTVLCAPGWGGGLKN